MIAFMAEKTQKFFIGLFLIFFILLSLIGDASFSSALERVPGVIHLETNISGGILSPEEMVKRVREAGLKVAVITDKENQRVEYGMFPLRKIIRKVEERRSVRTFGAKNYLSLIDTIAKKYPDMTIIPGVEAVPFYYWEGSYFNNNLKLVNFHKELLVLGLERPEDLEGIPSISYNNFLRFKIGSLLSIWPILLILLGLWLVFKKKVEHIKLMQLYVQKEKRPYILIGLMALLAGIIFTANNFPFGSPLYDQYHGDMGDMGSLPYQNLINYVGKKGGMVFWAHPDVGEKQEVNGIDLRTRPYHEELLKTSSYTGFAVLVEGMKFTGRIGGVWDEVLKEYINGQRKRPVWAIGELDYKDGPWMGETLTVFLVHTNNKTEIFNAMRQGRMYAVFGTLKPLLDLFQIWDDQENHWVEMGDTATVKNGIRIKIKVSLPDKAKGEMKLKLIREGMVIKEIDLGKGLDVEHVDDYFKPGRKTYYRIDIDSRLISNPIFVKMEGKSS